MITRFALVLAVALIVHCAGLFAQAPSVTPKNLVYNGGFETASRRENLWYGVDSAGYASFCCAATVASALAQTNGQFPVPINVIEPTPTPQTSPVLVPEIFFPPPTPAPLVSPTAAPTPLPDGTMPLPLPVMPTPALQDAKTLSEQLNVPIPAPSQFSEPPMKPGEWKFLPAIVPPLPTPAPTPSPTPAPMQSHQ